jgi:hypothetical protein
VLKALLSLAFALCMSQAVRAQEIRVNNTSEYHNKGRFKWTLFIEADSSLLREIDYVKYRLDPAYGDKAMRYVSEPRGGKYPFSTSDTAFDPSQVSITVYFKNKSSRRLPDYTLKLRASTPARKKL